MMKRESSARVGSSSAGPWWHAGLPLAGILAVGGMAMELTGPTRELAAEMRIGEGRPDADGDGLSTVLERVLQTDPYRADSDKDGYCDAEELARGSSPIDTLDTPLPSDSGMALAARWEGGELRVALVLYYVDGTLENKELRFGALLGNDHLVDVSTAHLLQGATLRTRPTSSGSGEIAILDFRLPTGAIHSFRKVTLFATMSVFGQGSVSAAAVIDFFVTPDGVLMQKSSALSRMFAGSGGGTDFYQPLLPGGELPIGWMPGRICQQTTEIVASSNGIVTTRVNSADCADGWDSYCSPPECKGSVGDEYATVDPLGLVGG
jgi:hypothetical protein